MNLSPPLKILQVCTSRSWGGMEMQTLQTINRLRTHGLEMTLLCHPQSALRREAEAAGVTTLPIPFGNAVHPVLIYRLRRFLRSHRFDLMHAHFSRDLRFIVPAGEGLSPRLPIVLTKHVGSYVKKKDPLHRYLYSRIDLVTAISQVIRDNVIDTCPIEAARVKIIHNGVDLRRFAPSEATRARTRAALNIREGDVVVGMVGRMSPGKGHEEFLHAAKEIFQVATNARFLVVGGASFGEEPYAISIGQLCKELNLSEQVVFTGFRRDVPELMTAIDLLAFPSHAEAFGNVVIEAMAMAKPVVSTNCDGVVDIVVDGLTGLQVPRRDPHALAAGLLKLIGDAALREKFGKAGRQRVMENFDEEKQTKQLIVMYNSLLGRR
jgi:glycosyltransferase involved in cell wall biosynthesis